MRNYRDKQCRKCSAWFAPTGPRSVECDDCKPEKAIPPPVGRQEALFEAEGYPSIGVDDLKRDTLKTLTLSNPRSPQDGRYIGTKCRADCHTPFPGSWSHCTVCHSSFHGVTYFDLHRYNGECINPVELGLRKLEGLWATPEGHEQRRITAERLALSRS